MQILEIFQVLIQRQVPLVLTVQRPVEIPQDSAVAVHQQIRRHPCRLCPTTGAHGLDCGDSTGAFLGQGCWHACLLCDDRCPWSQLWLKTVQVPQLLFIDKFVDIFVVVVQRQVAMVLTVHQNLVEIPQVHLLYKIVDILVCCATTGAHGLTCAENCSGSAVTIHRQIRRNPVVVVQRQSPMVLSVQRPVEIPQVHFLASLLICPLLCDDRCPGRCPTWCKL